MIDDRTATAWQDIMATFDVTDPRVLAGMRAQLESRATRIAAGGKRLGWKAGFGAPAALQKFGLAGPLAGFMLADARVGSGDAVSIAGWTKPVAEPEIAVYIGNDIADGRDRASVVAAISGIGPAIELADLNPPPEDVAGILSGNIFHRRVLLGPCDTSRAGARLEGIAGQITRSGVAMAPVTGDALEANTGRVIDVVAHIASTLRACGEKLQSGDVVICGSVVPPLFLEPGDTEVAFSLSGIGGVSVRFTRD
jgi:2-keto-4-pentenoate hydratase